MAAVAAGSIAFKVCCAFGLRRREVAMPDLQAFGPIRTSPRYRLHEPQLALVAATLKSMKRANSGLTWLKQPT
ncbi:hypothetical protein [Pseudonocardia parietis]|uniref:Uncharacterized protein n=1 Tax=Pseudonocardia parietis TaxID=570936 RepID=A0ABS4W6N1_9PSEU|nr:hypothetical protein [Pseudonocardia parietis]MBP2371863.1 hypothetical protein [Pseudonocardia parietis]